MPNKPIWTEGLLISQHHFQQQDRYHESILRDQLQAVCHHAWGITELEIDDRALASNQFKLKRFSAIWPDGATVRCVDGADDGLPPPKSFENAFPAELEKLEVFVGLAHESETAGNTVSPDDASVARRYLRSVRNVLDLNSGGSPQEVEWAKPNLRILFGTERRDGFATIRVAELVRQPNGQPIVRDNYIPPVLRLEASPFLCGGLQRVLTAVSARQRQLAAERKQRVADSVEYHATDARKFWLLHTLNGAIPELSHMLDARRAHPEEVHLFLARLIGQLCSFSVDFEPTDIPKFNYTEMGEPFETMFARIIALLPGGIRQQYVEIPLEHRPDGMFLGRIPDPKLTAFEFFVAVKSNQPEANVRERIPAVLKMGSWGQIYDIVKQARHGVKTEIEWKPSGALPIKPGLCFFRVRREGPFWEDVAANNTVALYLPVTAEWTGTSLSLYAVDPANLR